MTFIVLLNMFWLVVTAIPEYQKENKNIPSGKNMTWYDRTFMFMTRYLQSALWHLIVIYSPNKIQEQYIATG